MPSAVSPDPQAGSGPPDDLDRLLDYDDAVEDFLRDLPVGNDNQDNNNNGATAGPPLDEDQEVQVKKKRNPIPKLDENRLLSDAGIPKLRRITKTRLKFRGKGHEFTDISRLLNTYQLWLDDLYPRAKFRDALTIVEKVGHSKRMQVMRRSWLDDTKPYRKELTPDVEVSGANEDGERSREEREASSSGEATGEPTNANSREQAGTIWAPEDDELDAMLAENGDESVKQAEKPQSKHRGPFEEEDMDEDEDELNALMAEHTRPAVSKTPSRKEPTLEQGPDEDELDALMAEQAESGARPKAPAEDAHRTHSRPENGMDDFADDEEAMQSMGGMW
ncbi:Chromosome segregation in meiosis 3 [Lecanosticta acicola]|uniref:Chromosome segregation in meiosis protein n=1 Tax=Lecanosticta acicola TaxID=111012 RepID=A0AAI8Z106_9PEZI|nr:Chromosome segregation in meiosis 3 [Lecanosticta acicola]